MTTINAEMVRLNVGGRHYTTTLTTLLSAPNSVLANMFSHPNPAMLDENGRYFIDRNGDAFEPILEYLRSSQLLDFGISKERIKKEAEYFGLNKLLEMLNQPDPEPEEPKQGRKTVILVNHDLMICQGTLGPKDVLYNVFEGDFQYYSWFDVAGRSISDLTPYEKLKDFNVWFDNRPGMPVDMERQGMYLDNPDLTREDWYKDIQARDQLAKTLFEMYGSQ